MQETTDSPHNYSQATAADPGQSPVSPATVEGLVVALAPDAFEVSIAGEMVYCVARGRLRRQRPSPPAARAPGRPASNARQARKNPPASSQAPSVSAAPERPTSIAPGDRVSVTLLGGGNGVIEDIAPRRNALSRARSELEAEHVMMANVDLAVLVFAVREPEPRLGLLDRYLALCEGAGIAPLILFNKVDLGITPEIERAMALYAGLGYPVERTSATSGHGVTELRAWLAGRTSLLTGPSGVGKSSLMNVILPDANQRIGEISTATGKGRHTTTGARLLPFPEGGWLADTAGIRELALWNTAAAALPSCFVELRPYADDCEYEDCAHDESSEGCALRAALADGRIAPSRWESFTRLLAEAREKEKPRWASASR